MVAVAAYGLAIGTWTLAGSLAVLLVLAVAAGLVEGPMMPAMFAARQQYSPVALQGRVSTTAASLRVGAAALGQAAAGLLVPIVGTHTALLLVASGLLAASGAGWAAGRSRSYGPRGGRGRGGRSGGQAEAAPAGDGRLL
jgi:hypothetical protein